MNAFIVRLVATVALLLWPILYPITLLAVGPPAHSIWQDFVGGAAWLLTRIKLGGL